MHNKIRLHYNIIRTLNLKTNNRGKHYTSKKPIIRVI